MPISDVEIDSIYDNESASVIKKHNELRRLAEAKSNLMAAFSKQGIPQQTDMTLYPDIINGLGFSIDSFLDNNFIDGVSYRNFVLGENGETMPKYIYDIIEEQMSIQSSNVHYGKGSFTDNVNIVYAPNGTVDADCTECFYNCSNLAYINDNFFNTKFTNLSRAFQGTYNLNQGTIKLDLINCSNINYMFQNSNVEHVELYNWSDTLFPTYVFNATRNLKSVKGFNLSFTKKQIVDLVSKGSGQINRRYFGGSACVDIEYTGTLYADTSNCTFMNETTANKATVRRLVESVYDFRKDDEKLLGRYESLSSLNNNLSENQKTYLRELTANGLRNNQGFTDTEINELNEILEDRGWQTIS